MIDSAAPAVAADGDVTLVLPDGATRTVPRVERQGLNLDFGAV